MRKTKEDYPSVHTWSYITIEEFPKNSSCRQVLTNLSKIEGYCMLNMDYGVCYSRYSYELKPDRSLKRVKNQQYDPSKKPDPYPEGCPRSVRSTCLGCTHFAWCDPRDDEKHDPVQVHAGAGKKARKAGRKPGIKRFFGLLPDWKIDTPSLKDELRD